MLNHKIIKNKSLWQVGFYRPAKKEIVLECLDYAIHVIVLCYCVKWLQMD
jgi:hypothetical protein